MDDVNRGCDGVKIEHLVLPEPGRSLLKKTHAILARQFPDGNREPGFVVGGGTMLAARWKYRSSRDIDVRVSNKAGHQLLSRMLDEPKLQTRLNWSMDRAGAVHRRRLDRHQLIYFFEPMAVQAARVDLTPRIRRDRARTSRRDSRHDLSGSRLPQAH